MDTEQIAVENTEQPIVRRRFTLRWRSEWTTVVTFQLLVATLLLRLLWLNMPEGSLVFDEAYYVNAARVILGWPVPEGGKYLDAQPGLDPNVEHLPLAKVIVAGSMRLLGDNAYGWRLPSVILGTGAVGLLYLLVRRLTRRSGLALFAAFIFSFDNLVFVHGRIATLDIFMLFFMLLGVYFYVARLPYLAGAAIAISTLSKFNGLFTLVAIVGFEVLRYTLRSERRGRLWRTLSDLLLLIGCFILVFLALLWPLDRFFTTYPNPLDHVAHVYQYGVALSHSGGPQGIESMPWQWLVNQSPISYLKVDNNVVSDGNVVSSQPLINFVGAMNPFVIALLPVAVAFLIQAALHKRDDFSLLMLSLMVVFFGQPLATALVWSRISYIFYFLPVLPALCAGIAYFFVELRLPRSVLIGYVASVILGFVALFPFHTIF